MPPLDLDIRLLAIGAAVLDDCLEVPPAGGAPARQLRVADGAVFMRACRDGVWRDDEWRCATPDALFGYFVDDSPVASWLRSQGADLIRLALVSLGR